MSNFNKVFLVVKKKCTEQKNFAEINCFPTIAKEAGVPKDKLSLYLNHLQEIGLIKYSMDENYIYLTAQGHKQDNVDKVEIKSLL